MTERPLSSPAAIVFDLGGVLIDWNPRYLYRKLFRGDEAAMESFLAQVTTAEWNALQDAGRTWADAVDQLAAQHPDKRDLITAYWHRWGEMLGGAIEPTVAILGELRDAGVRLFALTNWSAETFPIARERYPFLAWFEAVVVSGEVRLAKPDPAVFRHLLAENELEAASTLFIDDSDANVRAAAKVGLQTIRYETPAHLRERLVELRLLG